MAGLSHEQYARLFGWLGSPRRRLQNLQSFLDRTGLGDARLRAELKAAIDAMDRLAISFHYRSCRGGVSGADTRPPLDEGDGRV